MTSEYYCTKCGKKDCAAHDCGYRQEYPECQALREENKKLRTALTLHQEKWARLVEELGRMQDILGVYK